MADADVTPVVGIPAGASAAWLTPVISTWYHFRNTKDQLLLVWNASAGSINVTINRYAQFDGDVLSSRVVAVAAGAIVAIAGLDPRIYNNTADAAYQGKTQYSFSAVASVSHMLVAVR